MYEARNFSQKSYDDNDSYAKEKFIKFLEKRGYTITSSEENYEHDVVAEKEGVTHYFELEVKRNYPFTTSDSFKFATVSFCGRKERLHKIHKFHYVIICYETGYAVTATSDEIFKEEYREDIELNTYDRRGKDSFRRVPKNVCKFFNIN